MKMKKFLIWSTAAFVMAGCSEEMTEELSPVVGSGTMTFTAAIEEEASRVYVDGTDEEFPILWDANDEISVFAGNGTNLKGTLTSGADTRKGEFTVSGTPGTTFDSNWGVYPYDSACSLDADGTLHVTLPAVQSYKENSYGGLNVSMTAVCPREQNYAFTFRSYVGAIGIQLTGNATVGGVRLTTLDGTLVSGAAAIATPYEEYPVAELSSGSASVTLDCGTAGRTLDAAQKTVFCIALPPQIYKGLRIEVLGLDGKEVLLTKETSKEITINRSKIRMMASLDVQSVIDLGDPSNCYIVSGPGRYKFPAKRVTTTDVGTFDYLNWVWKTEGVNLTDIEYDQTENYIYFTVGSFVKGNALIAAYDSTTGMTVHSWHLWFTDRPAEIQMSTGKMLLDRNLGAISTDISSPDSYGLLYQWGRKDPLYNNTTGSINREPEINPDVYGIYGDRWDNWKEIYDLFWCEPEDMYNYPLDLFYAYHDFSDLSSVLSNYLDYSESTINWVNTSYTNGTTGSIYNIYHISDPYDALWSTSKTNLDPCPAGYRVPSKSELGGLTTANKKTLPLQGFRRYDGTLYNVTAASHLNCLDTFYNTLRYSYSRYSYWTYQIGSYSYMYAPDYSIDQFDTIWRADAYAVRCIKE